MKSTGAPVVDTITVHLNSTPPLSWTVKLKRWLEMFKISLILQHIGLWLGLMGYTVAGSLIFRHLEAPAEQKRIDDAMLNVAHARHHFVQRIDNHSHIVDLNVLIAFELQRYEQTLQDAFSAGLSFEGSQPIATLKWTPLKAVFFCSTVLTTIGYGNIVPETMAGKVFCIGFALIGIPLTLIVIADWGRLFATALSEFAKRAPPLPLRKYNARGHPKHTSYAIFAIGLLFVYIAIGGGLFVLWEEDWTFFDGFYFCFITMTTIGFGDLVPDEPNYMLLCTVYILVGLALTSTIIELVRRQYAESWRQLQALRGPFADNLRKLADNAPGLDVQALQQDLVRFLTISMPKGKPSWTSLRDSKRSRGSRASYDDQQQQIQDALEAMIRDLKGATHDKSEQKGHIKASSHHQFVIYETSV